MGKRNRKKRKIEKGKGDFEEHDGIKGLIEDAKIMEAFLKGDLQKKMVNPYKDINDQLRTLGAQRTTHNELRDARSATTHNNTHPVLNRGSVRGTASPFQP